MAGYTMQQHQVWQKVGNKYRFFTIKFIQNVITSVEYLQRVFGSVTVKKLCKSNVRMLKPVFLSPTELPRQSTAKGELVFRSFPMFTKDRFVEEIYYHLLPSYQTLAIIFSVYLVQIKAIFISYVLPRSAALHSFVEPRGPRDKTLE